MHTYQRTSSDKERRRLKRNLPWFGRRRQDRLTDIDQGLIHVYEFDVLRSWDINGCLPPCCPYTFLFQTTEDLFVYVETWEEIDRKETASSEGRLVIESTPATLRLVRSTIAGPIALKHDEKLRELNEFFEINGDAEWRTLKNTRYPIMSLSP